MNIDAETVRKVAKLSSITLSEEEVSQYQSELSKVLSFVTQLDELPLHELAMQSPGEQMASPVTPTVYAQDITPFRIDEATQELSRADLMSNGREVEEGAYIVPNIL
jgi:aspartyl-tRNA(Asn)/glutamyl-tRNA(Gln) amidotransferase subunit C